jgi:N-methylhydantoinase B
LRPGDGRSPVGRVVDPDTLGADGAEVRDLGPKPGFFELRAGDVFAYSFQGGGGYGDPLDRVPEDVARDVAAGLVSRAAAERLYGVVIDGDGVPDPTATQVRRVLVRTERLDGSPPARPAGAEGDAAVDGLRIGDHLVIEPGGRAACRCGESLGSAADWKAGAVRRVVDSARHGEGLRLHPELELREYVCGGCGALLESEVARVGAADLVSLQLG